MTIANAANLTWHWLEELANCSETQEPNSQGVTRLCATPEHRRANSLLSSYMYDSGMDVRMDNAGNLIGRYASSNPSAKTLILGSHQDTVPNGGKYDGILGVVLPIALVHYLSRHRVALPFHVDVVAFSDEEGTRFQSTLLGSKALAGTFDAAMLDSKDRDGVTLHQALTDFGCKPELIAKDAYKPEKVLGFVEVHIEQGPVLEQDDLAVGVVSAITGIERHTVSVKGKAGHAGTVPMESRQDALVGAARIISILDNICKSDKDLVGVVGKISNFPNGVNVIPQQTDITIELRSPNDEKRIQARQKLFTEIEQAMTQLNLKAECEQTYEQKAVICSEGLTAKLKAAVESRNMPGKVLFSGAGHDGLAMTQLTDIAMLFVRCKDGVSHHPDEAIKCEDIRVALEVLESFITTL